VGPHRLGARQLSRRKPENLRKCFTFSVTSTKSFTLAMAAIIPSTHGGGLPTRVCRARSRACHSAAAWSYGSTGYSLSTERDGAPGLAVSEPAPVHAICTARSGVHALEPRLVQRVEARRLPRQAAVVVDRDEHRDWPPPPRDLDGPTPFHLVHEPRQLASSLCDRACRSLDVHCGGATRKLQPHRAQAHSRLPGADPAIGWIAAEGQTSRTNVPRSMSISMTAPRSAIRAATTILGTVVGRRRPLDPPWPPPCSAR
jgi:hypothetical protein